MLTCLSAAWTGAKALISGNSLALYLGIGLAASVLLGWLFWSRASIKADLATSEANVSTLTSANQAATQAISELQLHAQDVEHALAARELIINDISAQRDIFRQRYQEAIAHDQETRDWSAVRLPDAVVGLLQ